jgi:hypothetical protein
MKGIVMEDLSARAAQEVLDDHLKLDEHFGAEEDWRRIVEGTSAATSQRIS